MLRAAIEFVKSASDHDHPAGLLDELKVVAQKHRERLNVFAAVYLPPRSSQYEQHRHGRSFFMNSEFSAEQFWAEYQPFAIAKGSATNEYARRQSAPFTLSEASRALQLTGDDRWPIEVLRKFNIRDVLYCPFRRWMLLFISEHGALQIEQVDRQVLAWAAGAAIAQVERLVKKPWPPDRPPDLSPRELTALRHRSDGHKNPEVANRMGIGAESVATYLKRAMVKLDAKDVTEAVAKAMRLGLLLGAQ